MFVIVPLSNCASPAKRDRFLNFISKIARVTQRNEPKCHAYAWFRSAEDTDTVPHHWVRGLEVYEDIEANSESHRASAEYIAFRAAVAEEGLLERPSDLRFWRPASLGFLTHENVGRDSMDFMLRDNKQSRARALQYVVVDELTPRAGEKTLVLEQLGVLVKEAEGIDKVLSFWVLHRGDGELDGGVCSYCIDTFQGKLVHSARWDDTYDFKGKKVATIGIGSSGIQIVPQLAKLVDSMDVYVRTQTWISPAPGINEPTANDPEMDPDYNFTEATLELFKDPKVLCEYRAAIMDRRVENFKRAIADSDVQKSAQELFRKSMIARLGPGFLEALTQENIEMQWDDVVSITQKGIITRSGEKEYDVIVCATGFHTSFQPSFPLIGRNGADLARKWEGKPEAYFGIATPELPNYFSFIGPNSPISNGSLVLGIQATAVYIYKWLEKLQTEMIRSFEVRQDATDEYNQHIQQFLERTVWTRGCRSWYKRGTVDGPVTAIYGGTSFHFMEALKNPRWEDFHIDRLPVARNRFAYLGNGFSLREAKGGSVGATQTQDFDEYWRLFVLPEIHN
ncbi:hypothetical protein BDW59DRAFT_156556 [Aspergillus cavernicola]|uniref:ABM domain-containing protein n=1 Tax=Aspergillus cavernicola TaxID=176166 RepID=A0ABR4J140_9EURO